MDNNNMNEEKTRTSNKRAQKAERREAKATRKAANKVEEKNSRPNNVLLAVLIFGVLIGMFIFVGGYNYFSKAASIESYIADNGGEEVYGSIAIDEFTTAAITAEKNSMNIELNMEADETIAEVYKGFYEGDSGKKQLENIAAYFLTSIKPSTRAFSADVKASMKINGEEINTAELTYKEAEKIMKGDDEESEPENADASAETEESNAEESAAEDVEEAAEEAVEETEAADGE